MNFKLCLYVVMTSDGQYFGGYDSVKNKAIIVSDARAAKKFTNKHDIKLRPSEQIVELTLDLSHVELTQSAPFRPQKKS